MTARDIAFTWRLEHDPASGFVAVHPWSRATAVDVVDDGTAVLHLDRTYTSFALWDEVLPEHVEGPVAAAAATPADYFNHTLYNRDPTNPGLWDGPFVVTDYRVNERVGFVPNPHWSGTPPGLRRITLHDSRHTTLTLMEHAGVPISIVSKWAGHYDSAFTQKTYVHVSDDDLQQGRAALAKIHKTSRGKNSQSESA